MAASPRRRALPMAAAAEAEVRHPAEHSCLAPTSARTEMALVGAAHLTRWLARGSQVLRRARGGPGLGAAIRDFDFRTFWTVVKKAEAEAQAVAVGYVRKAMPTSWQAAMTYLERKFPRQWGRFDRHELTSADGCRPAPRRSLGAEMGRRRQAHPRRRQGSLADAEIGTAKTGARTVPVSSCLYADLNAWHIVSGQPSDHKLVFPGHEDQPWSRSQANNWRARVWKPVLKSLATE